jgi:RNA polymerase sigma-70 factor, ECF subfamily
MHRAVVVRAQQGDEEAFVALVREVGDTCMAIAYRILRDVDLAEDAVQASIVTAWRELRALRDPDRFEGWLYKLLVHACYTEAKRARHHRAEIIDIWPEVAFTRDDTLTVQDRDQLERGFRRLSPEQRAILVLHHYVGMTISEVAERLAIPEGTAKSRLHYASSALRAALEADARIAEVSGERSA